MKIIRLEDLTPGMELQLRSGDLTPEEWAEVYRLSREMFTADDLAACLQDEPGIPADEFLREVEELFARPATENAP
jgi:hypothetical protein